MSSSSIWDSVITELPRPILAMHSLTDDYLAVEHRRKGSVEHNKLLLDVINNDILPMCVYLAVWFRHTQSFPYVPGANSSPLFLCTLRP